MILKLREYLYQHCDAIKTFSLKNDFETQEFHEKKLINLLRGLRNVLEQSNFLDLKINYDFLLNPPKNYPTSSLISPLIYSDDPKVAYEILMTLNFLNNMGENLRALSSNDKNLLAMQLTSWLNTIDLSAKTPLLNLIQGERTEEDRMKLVFLVEKLGLELDDFNNPKISSFVLLRKKEQIAENQYTLEQMISLSKVKTMRYYSNASFRVFLGLHLILASELMINGIKPYGGEYFETFNQTFKEEKRALLTHSLQQMTRIEHYNQIQSPDLSTFIYETLQLSGFSYECLISQSRNPKSNTYETRLLEGVLVRKMLEFWSKKLPFISNKSNIVWFLKLADKLRFSLENLEAQMKGIDMRGLLSFAEEEKQLLDKIVEVIALDVLSEGKHLQNIELLVPIIIYFKTVYNQEQSQLFDLFYTILQDLIEKSLENQEQLSEIRRLYGYNLIEESILQLLQLFFVFEIRNEATEKLNKSLLNKEFFIKVENSIQRKENLPIAHFIFNQVLFHSLTNDNNIIRDFLIENLEYEAGFERFLRIFSIFFEENKVVFLCNFNLLRKKVLKICEDANNKLEILSLDPRNLLLCQLYSQIFTSCFLLWADTSSLDNDFLEIKCLKALYEDAFIKIMRKLRVIAKKDEENFLQMLEISKNNENYKPYFLIFCDSFQKKYKLILENFLYFMKSAIVKLYDNNLSQEFFNEFLMTFVSLNNPLVNSLNKDYQLSRIHAIFESNFTLNLQKNSLITHSLEFLLVIFKDIDETLINSPEKLISFNENSLKSYEKILNQDVSHWKGLLQAKKLEMILSLIIGIIRKPHFIELLNTEMITLLFEISQKIQFLITRIKPIFFIILQENLQEFQEETMEIEHYCSVHPQNDFSRKILHKYGLLRQCMKFLLSLLKIKSRGIFQSEIKKLHDLISQNLMKNNTAELFQYSESEFNVNNNAFIIQIVFLFDELRRFSGYLHESKLPHFFLSESSLMKIGELIRRIYVFNQENTIKHETLMPGIDLISRMNFYFFCRIILNFLPDFLIKSLLFNEFSFIIESDFLIYLSISFEKVFKMIFLLWKGFFKSNEEIPLKLIKIIESLNSRAISRNSIINVSKPRNKSRLLHLNHAVLQLFLESTYQIGLRIRSIYFYKLLHIICLLNDSRETSFSQTKAPYLAYFIRLLEKHFKSISADWKLSNSPIMFAILNNYHSSANFKKESNKIKNVPAIHLTQDHDKLSKDSAFLLIMRNNSERMAPHLTHDDIEEPEPHVLISPKKSRLNFSRNSLESAHSEITNHRVLSQISFKNSFETNFNILPLPLLDPLDIIQSMGTIESACIQAMLTNLISRMLFSEEIWDSDPALEPGLREMYWNWNATKDFSRYVSRLLEKLSQEKAYLNEEELDTLHNDTIGNLIEMLKENLPEENKNKLNIEDFLEVCFDFLEKYFQQQKIQINSSEKTSNVNVIRPDVLRDLIGIIGSGLSSLSVNGKAEKIRSVKKADKLKKKTMEILVFGLKNMRMYKETGFHEKFSQEFLRLIEILILEENEDIRSGSLEFLIKSSFYDGKQAVFKQKINYKELFKENIEKSFNANGMFFVNNLYKLCIVSDEKEEKTANEIAENLSYNREEITLTLRKGIIPEEIQGISEFQMKNGFWQKILAVLMQNCLENVIEQIAKNEEKTKILDLDISIKILVLLLGKYPILMPFCLEYQMVITNEYRMNLVQKQRLTAAKKAFNIKNEAVFSKFEEKSILEDIYMNFLEFCYIFYDHKPHVFRQFLLLFCNQDFNYLRISPNSFISSSKIIRKTLMDLFHSELNQFLLGITGPKTVRYLESSDDILLLRNLLNLYYKTLINRSHLSEENPNFLKEKLLEFLEILLEILRRISHPLDLIVLRDINYFAYLAHVYKQIVKISFTIQTGLLYSKSNEYLKYYLNKQLKPFFLRNSKEIPHKSKPNPDFHNLIFSQKTSPKSKNQQFLDYSELFPRLISSTEKKNCSRIEWLLIKEKEIHDYSKNIAIFNQQATNYAKLFLESREDLRRLSANNPDMNIYENLKNMIKAGIVKESSTLGLSRENYDQNCLKYIVWPTNSSIWLEKMQDSQLKSSSKKIFLTLEQMIFELKSLTQEIKLALKNEALKYALENEENSENNGLNELQTQSCLTILGSDEHFLDNYYQNPAEISQLIERKFTSQQNLIEILSENEEKETSFAQKSSKKLENSQKNTRSLIGDLENEEIYSAKGPLFEEKFVKEESSDENSERNFQRNCVRDFSEENSEGKQSDEEDEDEEEQEEDEEDEKEEDSERNSKEKAEKSRFSTEMDEESKEMPDENNNTPTFLDKYGIDQGYFSLIPEEMREEVIEGARELYEERHYAESLEKNLNNSNNDKFQIENLKKFKLLLQRESALIKETPFLLIGKEDPKKEMLNLEKIIENMPYSIKKKVFLQADKNFLANFSEKIRKEAEEILREIHRESAQSFEENLSSKEDETWDNYEGECSEDEEEEKIQMTHSINECRSLKFIDEDQNNMVSQQENQDNLSNLAESSNNSEDKLMEKTLLNDEFKKPQTSFMKKMGIDKSDKFESEGGAVKKTRNKAKKKPSGKKPGYKERFLFKNYKKIKEIDENLNKIDFFLELPEIEDEILLKLFEMLNYSLVLSDNSTQTSLKSLFKLFKTLLFNPYNAYKLIDGLIYLLFHYNDQHSFEGVFPPAIGYGLIESYPLITKREIINSGVLNNVFLLINKLVENHYCLPLFLQAKIEKQKPLHFKQFQTENTDFSMGFIRILRNQKINEKTIELLQENLKGDNEEKPLLASNENEIQQKIEIYHKKNEILLENDINQTSEKTQFLPENQQKLTIYRENLPISLNNPNEPVTLLNLLISYLTIYEGNCLSYLNGDILLTLIKNLLKLSVINDGFLSQKIAKYPKYKIDIPSCDSHDITSLCQIFYQKRIRLKYFDSCYYELFLEYSKSPLNFERFFLALMSNYTQKFNEDMILLKQKALEFNEKFSKEKKIEENKLKNFWESVLLDSSHNSLAEDFHIFRHIVKDLVILFETPLKMFYEETVYKEFHKKFGFSVRDLDKIDHEAPQHSESEKNYLKEWLNIQKNKKKEAFLGHLKERIFKNESIVHFFELTVDVLRLMMEIFGVEFQGFGAFENERLEDCYYFFIYPVKSFLILYNFLNNSQEEACSNDFIGVSGIKTKEILKSEKDFSEKDQFDYISEPNSNNSGLLSLKQSNNSDFLIQKLTRKPEKLEKTYEILLNPNFMKLITFFMQSKAEPDKLGNYLDYIRRAKKRASLSLDVKLGYLRSYSKIKACSKKNSSRFLDEPLTIYINRQTIWQSTLDTLLMVPSEELALRPIKIVFEGEEGIDYGGITREWLSLLNKEVFDPNFGLFKLSANQVSYQPNPLSFVIPDHLTHFRELGRLTGKILLDNLNIEVNFVQSFLKHILGQTLYIRDLSSIDPDLCKNLEWILENDVKDLDLAFAYDMNYFDLPILIELVENGQNLRVVENNKKEYVKQMCYAKMASEIKPQTEAFLSGFLTLIPREALDLIDDKELGMKLCGTSQIDGYS